MILSCGESLIDFVPETDTEGRMLYSPCPGGSPLNTAIAAARLGVPTAYFSKISTDFFGDILFDRLAPNQIVTDFVLRGPEPTTLAFVQRDDAGNARYAFYSKGSADRTITVEELPHTLPKEITCIQVGSVALILEPVAASLERFIERESHKRVIAFDPNVRPTVMENESAYRARVQRILKHTGILKISDEDLKWLYPTQDPSTAARHLADDGIPFVVLTRGKDGATAFGPGFTVTQPGMPVPGGVADTVGAGDSFHGGLLAALYREGVLTPAGIRSINEAMAQKVLEFAGRVAAITCSRPGADPPWDKDM